MKISIFKNSYSLGIDYSSREDCLGVFSISEEDIEKINLGATPKIVNEKLVIEETEEYEKEKSKIKKKEIFQQLLEAENIEEVDLQGLEFTDIEIGELILHRVFGGNPHAEAAMQAKTSAYIISAIQGTPNTELLSSIEEKKAQINEIRKKFNINEI